jgi:RNA polymerase sigma factor (TIGR02999 family)
MADSASRPAAPAAPLAHAPLTPAAAPPAQAAPAARVPDDMPQPGELTLLLRAAAGGDTIAFDRAFGLVYDELVRLAQRVRAGRAGETIDAPALVAEAYLKLSGSADAVNWAGRGHFFAVAARAMRQVLVGAARERMARKRGGGDQAAVTLDERAFAAPERPAEVLALDEALERLARVAPRQAQVVEFRYFAGYTAEQTAEYLDVSVPTVHRDWRAARAWLARELGADDGEGDGAAGAPPA